MTAIVVSLAHLLGILSCTKGARIVTFVARTDARLRKTGNTLPNKRATKVARVNGIVNWSYERAVNKALTKQGEAADFVAKPRTWGFHIPGTPFIGHKGTAYLEVKIERVLDTTYEDDNGNPLAYEQVAPFLPESREADVLIADYKVTSLTEFRIDGTLYAVDPATIEEVVNTPLAGALVA